MAEYIHMPNILLVPYTVIIMPAGKQPEVTNPAEYYLKYLHYPSFSFL